MGTTTPIKCWGSVICSVFIVVTVASGLKCRVDSDERTRDSFQDVMRACMMADLKDEEMSSSRPRSHHNWQHRPQWGQGIPRFPTRNDRDENRNQNERDDDDDDDNNSREQDYNRDNSHRGYHPRNRRSQPSRAFFGSRNNQTMGRKKSNSTPIDDIEPCIIHCIFRQMQMLDSKNQLDKTSVISAMTNKLRNSELKDFLRDAIAECFEILDAENQDTKCSFSKSFALCLEQKGQENCEDWEDDLKKPKHKHNVVINKHMG